MEQEDKQEHHHHHGHGWVCIAILKEMLIDYSSDDVCIFPYQALATTAPPGSLPKPPRF